MAPSRTIKRYVILSISAATPNTFAIYRQGGDAHEPEVTIFTTAVSAFGVWRCAEYDEETGALSYGDKRSPNPSRGAGPLVLEYGEFVPAIESEQFMGLLVDRSWDVDGVGDLPVEAMASQKTRDAALTAVLRKFGAIPTPAASVPPQTNASPTGSSE